MAWHRPLQRKKGKIRNHLFPPFSHFVLSTHNLIVSIHFIVFQPSHKQNPPPHFQFEIRNCKKKKNKINFFLQWWRMAFVRVGSGDDEELFFSVPFWGRLWKPKKKKPFKRFFFIFLMPGSKWATTTHQFSARTRDGKHAAAVARNSAVLFLLARGRMKKCFSKENNYYNTLF